MSHKELPWIIIYLFPEVTTVTTCRQNFLLSLAEIPWFTVTGRNKVATGTCKESGTVFAWLHTTHRRNHKLALEGKNHEIFSLDVNGVLSLLATGRNKSIAKTILKRELPQKSIPQRIHSCPRKDFMTSWQLATRERNSHGCYMSAKEKIMAV